MSPASRRRCAPRGPLAARWWSPAAPCATRIEAARACGYLDDAGRFLDEEAFGYLPPDKVMLLCTGSQGEPRAAIARIAEDQHPHVSLEPGDLVIFSSRTIPGNEKEVARVQNNLARARRRRDHRR